MNICYISSEPIPPQEGIGFYIWNLANHLVEQGHTIHIITRGGMERFSKVMINRITLWRPRFLPIYPFHVHFHQLFVDKLVRELEDEVDLFHIHSPLSPLVSTKRPVMLTVHSAIRSDAKQTPIRDMESLLLQLQAPVSVGLEKKHLRQADSVNVVAPHVADNLRAYPTCPPNIDVTWNGVDTDLFSQATLQSPSNAGNAGDIGDAGDAGEQRKQSVLSVGRLVPGKGWEDFLEAAAVVHSQNPEVVFKIAGDGPLRGKLEKKIAQSGLGDVVQMLGHVGGSDEGGRQALAALYRQATIYAMPSHYEGLPTVLLEAMASGCPIVSTRVGGVPNIVEEGKSGLLVEPHQPKSMARAINSLLSDKERRSQLGEAARKIAESRFSWAAISSRYLEQYEELIDRNSLQQAGRSYE